MNKEQYFVITMSEDGDVYLSVYAKEQLIKKLNDGDMYDVVASAFIEATDSNLIDLRERAGTIIIKGKLVTPCPKTTVTSFDVE